MGAENTNQFRPELLDELLHGVKTHAEMFGQGGLLKQLTGRLVEKPGGALRSSTARLRAPVLLAPGRAGGRPPAARGR